MQKEQEQNVSLARRVEKRINFLGECDERVKIARGVDVEHLANALGAQTVLRREACEREMIVQAARVECRRAFEIVFGRGIIARFAARRARIMPRAHARAARVNEIIGRRWFAARRARRRIELRDMHAKRHLIFQRVAETRERGIYFGCRRQGCHRARKPRPQWIRFDADHASPQRRRRARNGRRARERRDHQIAGRGELFDVRGRDTRGRNWQVTCEWIKRARVAVGNKIIGRFHFA